MTQLSSQWEARCAELWAALDTLDAQTFVQRIDALADERPAGDAIGLFEQACARDSTGHSDLAAPLYRQALAAGLSGIRRRRATIQLASSMRNLGQPHEAIALLEHEQQRTRDELDSAVVAFLSLALADVGREREALRLCLTALAGHLPRYNRSVVNYASDLIAAASGKERSGADA